MTQKLELSHLGKVPRMHSFTTLTIRIMFTHEKQNQTKNRMTSGQAFHYLIHHERDREREKSMQPVQDEKCSSCSASIPVSVSLNFLFINPALTLSGAINSLV